MFLIKDGQGNYFDAEKACSFEVRSNGIGFDVVASIISGDKFRDYFIMRYDTEEKAREQLDTLINTLRARC